MIANFPVLLSFPTLHNCTLYIQSLDNLAHQQGGSKGGMRLSSVRMPTAGSTGPSIMQAITQNSIFNQFAKTRIFAAYDPTRVPSALGAGQN